MDQMVQRVGPNCPKRPVDKRLTHRQIQKVPQLCSLPYIHIATSHIHTKIQTKKDTPLLPKCFVRTHAAQTVL